MIMLLRLLASTFELNALASTIYNLLQFACSGLAFCLDYMVVGIQPTESRFSILSPTLMLPLPNLLMIGYDRMSAAKKAYAEGTA